MKIRKTIHDILMGVFIVGITLLVTICLRIFVLASFKIPSDSMEPSILPGDYVIINKLVFGPRLFKNFHFMENEKIETIRLKGWRKIKHNDILVFNYPYKEWDHLGMDLNVFYMKRCIGVPGDTLSIVNGFYKVSGYKNILGHYENQTRMSQLPDTLFPENIFRAFPFEGHEQWNIKNMGPLYIPRSGDTVLITPSNIRLYQRLIEYENNIPAKIVSDTLLFLGKNCISKYTFKQNYYFMAGDNVLNSRDSRYWGLLPEDYIIGKAVRIWKSINPKTKKIRMDRFLKKIE